MLEAAEAWVPHMRASGADLVICLAHTGVAAPGEAMDTENCATRIAEVPGVDAVIAGHSHLVWPPEPRIDLPIPGAPAPIVQPGHSGSHLGLLDFVLHPPGPDGNGPAGWTVASVASRAMGVSEALAGLPQSRIRRAAAPIRQVLSGDHRAAMAWMRQPLGQTEVPLHSLFAPLVDTQALRLIAAAQVAHVKETMANGPLAELPVLAAVSPYRSGGRSGPMDYTNIPAGPLTIRNVHDLYPFPNTLVVLRLTGAALAARLNRGMAVYATLTPGRRDQPLMDPQVPVFRFETIPGLTYDLDLRGPERIRNLRYQGKPVQADQIFLLATNSHLSSEPPDEGTRVVLDDGTLCRDLLSAHIRRNKVILPDTAPGWRLRPLPGTTVLFDTGLGTAAHLDEIAHLRPEPLGLTPRGFQRFRLHL